MTSAPEPRQRPVLAAAPEVPAYDVGSLAEVMPAVLHVLGVATADALGVPSLSLPPSQRVVVVLVDGLGLGALRDHPDEAPYLTEVLAGPHSRGLTTVFPSTTPIALTSLGTGLAPSEHGVTGLYLRLAGDQVVNTLASPAETDLRILQPYPTVFERAAQVLTVTRVGPAAFDGKGLTEAALRGGDYAAAETPADRIIATAAAVRRGERSLTYVYWGDLDALGHRLGCETEAWRIELARVDRWVEALVEALPPGTTVLVTSDHGMVDIPATHRWDVAITDALRDGVDVVTGDLRGAQLHTRPGATEDVLTAWQETLGEHFWVVARDEAVAHGVYGPRMPAHVRSRLGDLLALAVDDHAVLDTRTMPARFLAIVGMHGGLSAAEVGIPLLVAVRD